MTYDEHEKSLEGGEPIECYRFAVGATVYRWTSSDDNVAIGSETYTPEQITREGADFGSEDDSGSIKVTVLRSNAVAQLFVSYAPVAPIALVVYRLQHAADDMVVMFSGKAAAVTFDGSKAVLLCLPMTHVLTRNVPRLVFQGRCNWPLYSVGCGFPKDTLRHSGTVDAVDGLKVSSSTLGMHAYGYWDFGWIEITATGERRYITGHDPADADSVFVQSAFPSLPVGTAIRVYPGCDKTEAMCSAKFNNLVRHLGFPRIPTANPYKTGVG